VVDGAIPPGGVAASAHDHRAKITFFKSRG
jgi:hypothetical protein